MFSTVWKKYSVLTITLVQTQVINLILYLFIFLSGYLIIFFFKFNSNQWKIFKPLHLSHDDGGLQPWISSFFLFDKYNQDHRKNRIMSKSWHRTNRKIFLKILEHSTQKSSTTILSLGAIPQSSSHRVILERKFSSEFSEICRQSLFASFHKRSARCSFSRSKFSVFSNIIFPV